MQTTRLVIVGGVAAGPKAAARARRCDPRAEITILEQGEFISFAGCGLPYFIGGQIAEARELMCTPVGVVRDEAFFRNVKDIRVLTRTRAVAIDRAAKTVTARRLDSGQEIVLPYDKLVLATGSRAVRLDLPGVDLPGVYTLRGIPDALAIREALAGVTDVVVIGAGLIGLEVVDALLAVRQTRELNITLVERLAHPLPVLLDPEMGALVARFLKAAGVNFLPAREVRRLEGQGRVERVVTDREEIPAQLVVVGVGVRPETELAQAAGLALGPTGAIAVNEYLQTSDPDIYAGGDCVENVHLVSGQKVYLPLGSTANRHGRVIGDNIAGGRDLFPGVVGTAILKLGTLNVGRTGLTVEEARRAGFDPVSVLCAGPDRAHYHPESKPLVIELIADRATRRLLGAQVLGPGAADKRLDVAATALTAGFTVDRLATVDLAYAPPYATALDLLTHAANTLRNKLDGRARGVSPREVRERLARGEDFVLLDVRTPKELEEARLDLPNVTWIPLDQLRSRAGELPRDKKIITFCKVSLRGYEAQLILDAEGLADVGFMEGGLAAWV
ncbi:MAG: FAD-dependent oxidoreductase [Desulfotomaculales bacterium]